MNTHKEFTVADGIAVQSRHLADWELKLKPEVYSELEKFALSRNYIAKTGYDITRGSDLSVFVSNLKLV